MSSIGSDPSSAPPSYPGSRAGTPSPSPSRSSTDSEVHHSYTPVTTVYYTPATLPNHHQPASASPIVTKPAVAVATAAEAPTNTASPTTPYRSLLPPLVPAAAPTSPQAPQSAKLKTGCFDTSRTYQPPKRSNRGREICLGACFFVLIAGGIVGFILLFCWMSSPVNPSVLKTMRGDIHIISTPKTWGFLAPTTHQEKQFAEHLATDWAKVQIYRIPEALLEERDTKENLPEGVEYMRCDGDPGKQKHEIGFRKRSLDEPEVDTGHPRLVKRKGRLFRRRGGRGGGGSSMEPRQYSGYKNEWEWERGWGIVWKGGKRLCMPHSDEMLELQRKWRGAKLGWWKKEKDKQMKREEKEELESMKSEKLAETS